MIYAENILICITIPLIFSLPFVRGSARRMIASVITGMVVCLLGAYISGFLSSINGMGVEDTAIFISPIVEEVMKLLPLLFVLFIFETGDRQIVVTAVGIGSGFATFENCCYILTTGADRLGYIMVRGFAVGVMHIVSMIAVTIGLVLARRYKAMSFAGLLGALSISACFHAIYNLLVSEPGVSSVIGYILPPLTAILLYLPYRRLGEETKIY